MVLNLGDMSYKTTLFYQKWKFLEKGVKTWYNQPLQTNKLLYKPSDYALYFEKFSNLDGVQTHFLKVCALV